MLELSATLDSGTLAIVSAYSSRGIAATNLTEGHAVELASLKSYLRRNVCFDAIIYINQVQVGTWRV